MKIPIFILDYNRRDELKVLLESIEKNVHFNKHVVVLNNGGAHYADEFLIEGLCDEVIHNDRNIGCGAATIQGFANLIGYKYAFYIQVDHELVIPLFQDQIDYFIDAIESKGYTYVDLAGDQGHGNYSERAQFIGVDYYNSIPKSIGGPGPWDHIKWTEECVQNFMQGSARPLTVLYKNGSISIPPFIDRGKYSTRTNPDGSQWIHRTDTKVIKVLKSPTEKYSFPPLSDEQWERCISKKWPEEGEVPSGWKSCVFNVWGD